METPASHPRASAICCLHGAWRSRALRQRLAEAPQLTTQMNSRLRNLLVSAGPPGGCSRWRLSTQMNSRFCDDQSPRNLLSRKPGRVFRPSSRENLSGRGESCGRERRPKAAPQQGRGRCGREADSSTAFPRARASTSWLSRCRPCRCSSTWCGWPRRRRPVLPLPFPPRCSLRSWSR